VGAIGILGRQQVVIVGKGGRLQGARQRGAMPQFLEAQNIGMQQADAALRPFELALIFALGPAIPIAVKREAGLVEIVQIKGADAQFAQIHGGCLSDSQQNGTPARACRPALGTPDAVVVLALNGR